MSCCAPGVEAGSQIVADTGHQISNEAIIAAAADLGAGAATGGVWRARNALCRLH